MIRVAIDTETALITPTDKAPPMTCLSYAIEGAGAGLLDRHQALPFVMKLLETNEVEIIGQNLAFDWGVMLREWGSREPKLITKIIQAHDANRVTDTLTRQQLADLAKGEMDHPLRPRPDRVGKSAYSLEALALRHLGRQLDKHTWRKRYGELRDVPHAYWEEGARKYPVDDAITTLDVCQAQGRGTVSPDEHQQVRHALWLNQVGVVGMKTDVPRLQRLQEELEQRHHELSDVLRQWEVLRADGTRDMKKAAALMLESVPADRLKRTEKGAVSLDAEACAMSSHPAMAAYAAWTKLNGIKTKDIPALLTHGEVHARFQALLETGRTSASGNVENGGYNVQNPARKGGIRECFIAREGKVLIDSDYEGLELATMAQACLWLCGRSSLADAILHGIDPHLELAADLVGCSYVDAVQRMKLHKAWKAGLEHGIQDELIAAARQNAKPANFGFPGGMGARKFVEFCASQDVHITEEFAFQLLQIWRNRRPEFPASYFPIHAELTAGGLCEIEQFVSRRVRGGCNYSQACNTRFQGLGGDAAKDAGWHLFKACYDPTLSSPLFGARIVNFIHDQFLVEQDESSAAEGALEVQRLMQERGREWLPDLKLTTEPCLSRCWSKNAVAVYDAAGRLIPWVEKH